MAASLVLMRHGKSAWEAGVDSDYDRSLAPRGERDVPRMARWLRERVKGPYHIVSSPALRARRTANLLAKELGVDPDEINWQRDVYEATVQELLATLAATVSTNETTVLVGHNPGMEELATYLADPGGLPDEPKLMPTSGVICLDLPAGWTGLRPGQCRVIAHMRPRWFKEGQA
jgi:phosphohistidine phosphatase